MSNNIAQIQTVPRSLLEKKLGDTIKYEIGERFTTKTGTWKIIDVNITDDKVEIIKVERIAYSCG